MKWLSDWVRNVTEFHAAGGLGIRDKPELPAHGSALRKLRRKLQRDEQVEYEEAEDSDDLVEIADALCDIIYVAIGTALEYGIPIDRAMAEVHRSNMTKRVDGKLTSAPNGKIVKPPTYEPPEIEWVLRSQFDQPPPMLFLHVERGAFGEAIAVHDQFGRQLGGVQELQYTVSVDSADQIKLICHARDEKGLWVAGRHA